MSASRIGLRLLTDTARDIAELQRVLEGAPGHALRATGSLPGPDEARTTFADLPPGRTVDDKLVYGIERDGTMVGCTIVVRGWPDETTAVIGLLLLEERVHRQGVGRAAYRLLEDEVIATWPECRRVRIGILDTNRDFALPFWSSLGFVANGQSRPYHEGTVESTLRVYLKPFGPDAS